MNSFDAASLSSDLGAQWDALDELITNTDEAAQIDIDTSEADFDTFGYLADPSNFACTAGTFQSESWVPSILSGAQISCTQSSGNKAGASECSTRADIQTSSNGCDGCISAHEVLAVSGSGNIQSDL